MKNQKSKDDRIEVRVSGDIKRLIEKAAQYRGVSLSAYATAILVENAKRVIEETGRLELSERDQELFIKALDRGPNRALVDAARRYQSVNGK